MTTRYARHVDSIRSVAKTTNTPRSNSRAQGIRLAGGVKPLSKLQDPGGGDWRGRGNFLQWVQHPERVRHQTMTMAVSAIFRSLSHLGRGYCGGEVFCRQGWRDGVENETSRLSGMAKMLCCSLLCSERALRGIRAKYYLLLVVCINAAFGNGAAQAQNGSKDKAGLFIGVADADHFPHPWFMDSTALGNEWRYMSLI